MDEGMDEGMDERTIDGAYRVLSVSVDVGELLYDVTNKAHLTGRSRAASGKAGYEEASGMQATDEGGEGYQLRRSIQAGFSELKGVLGEYVDEERTTADDLPWPAIEGGGTLTLALRVPANHACPSADRLASGVHSYLCYAALAEWFAMTDKEDAADCLARASAAAETVLRAAHGRRRPRRPENGTRP